MSLVFEADVQDDANQAGVIGAGQTVGKPDVYVIDENGVTLVRRRNRVVRAVLTAVATYFLLWAISRLLQGRDKDSP